MPSIRIKVDEFRTPRQKQLLKNYLNEPGVRISINEVLGKYINNYVPMSVGGGQLRESMRANEKSISWGAKGDANKYARYQYEGEIYGPNIPGAINGSPAWKSPPTKHPTGREIGAFSGTIQLMPLWQVGSPKVYDTLSYDFGYTTPGTKHHWDKLFNQDIRAKAEANREITRQLKRECKARGLKV